MHGPQTEEDGGGDTQHDRCTLHTATQEDAPGLGGHEQTRQLVHADGGKHTQSCQLHAEAAAKHGPGDAAPHQLLPSGQPRSNRREGRAQGCEVEHVQEDVTQDEPGLQQDERLQAHHPRRQERRQPIAPDEPRAHVCDDDECSAGDSCRLSQRDVLVAVLVFVQREPVTGADEGVGHPPLHELFLRADKATQPQHLCPHHARVGKRGKTHAATFP